MKDPGADPPKQQITNPIMYLSILSKGSLILTLNSMYVKLVLSKTQIFS